VWPSPCSLCVFHVPQLLNRNPASTPLSTLPGHTTSHAAAADTTQSTAASASMSRAQPASVDTTPSQLLTVDALLARTSLGGGPESPLAALRAEHGISSALVVRGGDDDDGGKRCGRARVRGAGALHAVLNARAPVFPCCQAGVLPGVCTARGKVPPVCRRPCQNDQDHDRQHGRSSQARAALRRAEL